MRETSPAAKQKQIRDCYETRVPLRPAQISDGKMTSADQSILVRVLLKDRRE
jgi:hypothetical protein